MERLVTVGDRQDRLAQEPTIGKRVCVWKGRCVPVGTAGVVFWIGRVSWGLRIGLKDDSDTVWWISANHVQVVDWQQYLPCACQATTY